MYIRTKNNITDRDLFPAIRLALAPIKDIYISVFRIPEFLFSLIFRMRFSRKRILIWCGFHPRKANRMCPSSICRFYVTISSFWAYLELKFWNSWGLESARKFQSLRPKPIHSSPTCVRSETFGMGWVLCLQHSLEHACINWMLIFASSISNLLWTTNTRPLMWILNRCDMVPKCFLAVSFEATSKFKRHWISSGQCIVYTNCLLRETNLQVKAVR